MINTVQRELMVALAVVQAASVALMAPALAVSKTSSLASLVAVLRVILMLRAKGMIFSIV